MQLDLDDALGRVLVRPMLVLEAVRAAVQQGIEPHPDGGVLLLRTAVADGQAAVTVAVDAAEPMTMAVPLDGAVVPG